MQARIQNIPWSDNARVLAVTAVILLHAASTLVYNREPSSPNWQIANVYDSAVRFCVPLFLMLSGALLLNKEEALSYFLQKRIARIIGPFLFWTIVYMVNTLITDKSTNIANLHGFLKWTYDRLAYGAEFHFWYVYLIIGIYLFLPVIRPWINKASGKEILYFLGIWLFTLFIALPGMSKFSTAVNLHYFAGYLGYPVLGYYLSCRLPEIKRIRIFALLIYSIGFFITAFGTYFFTMHNGKLDETLYGYLTPNVFVMSAGVFLLIRGSVLPVHSRPLLRLTSWISKHSYGIYLVHILVLNFIYSFAIEQLFHPLIGIPIITTICLLLSLVVVSVINKLPFGRYISG